MSEVGSRIDRCRVCDSVELEPAIDLGNQPWCNHFLTQEQVGHEPFYPLRVVYCHACATPQLDFTVPKEVMFGNHTYLSGVTTSLDQHFQAVAEEVDSFFFRHTEGKSVLDIGSNDGTQLKHFKTLGYDILGVEPSKTTAEMAMEKGITTVNEFFNIDLVRCLGRQFHVINAAGVFFHLEELHSAAEGIREALRPEGVFVVQFLYMKRIVENGAFDQIYHEHLLYYNLSNIEVLLNRHGLSLFDACVTSIHGGSVVAYVTHQGGRSPSSRLQALLREEELPGSNQFSTYQEFAGRIDRMKDQNVTDLEALKRKGQRVFGFGAPAKGNTLLNYFNLGTRLIECLVEKNVLRRGLFSPGMHIPIVLEHELTQVPDVYYVLAWNFKEEILTRNQHLVDQGIHFHFPVNPGDADR
ncbi:MAG: class I SAM-dependent methyltransferase [Armatimonadetes bacterium]|nr:class I SAM-dependent methyltransferase [Armatimonadota bacterium]